MYSNKEDYYRIEVLYTTVIAVYNVYTGLGVCKDYRKNGRKKSIITSLTVIVNESYYKKRIQCVLTFMENLSTSHEYFLYIVRSNKVV